MCYNLTSVNKSKLVKIQSSYEYYASKERIVNFTSVSNFYTKIQERQKQRKAKTQFHTDMPTPHPAKSTYQYIS